MLDYLKEKIIKYKNLTDKDVGWIADAFCCLIDLVHLEWHYSKNYWQTLDNSWLEEENKIRIKRTYIADKLVPKSKDDTDDWCIYAKHLPRVIGSFIELGNRELSIGNFEEGKKYFDWAGEEVEKCLKCYLKGGKNV